MRTRRSHLASGDVMTDYWRPYGECVPEEQHVRSKAETYTVEGYNSLFKHCLARLRRTSKCYSKCQEMLEHSETEAKAGQRCSAAAKGYPLKLDALLS